MKNGFGRIFLIVVMLCAVSGYASEPAPQPYLNTDNACGVPMGIMTARSYYGEVYYHCYVLHSFQHALYGTVYYTKCLSVVGSSNLMYGSHIVFWDSDVNQAWVVISWQSRATDACQNAYYSYISGLNGQAVLTDPQAVHADYFPPSSDDSRLPLDVDLDGNGRLDYYDLESQQYQDYLDMCAQEGVAPGDLADYMYWYQNDLEDWLALKNQLTDSDGDGFSDGYEIIHGTDPHSETSHPLGRPDVGTASHIAGGVDDPEPWRYEQYGDSGWSRGHVYDMGYDPFGDTPTETINDGFVGPPDWGALDSDGDGWSNQTESVAGTNPYAFNFHPQSEYSYHNEGGYWEYVGGVEPGPYPWGDPPTAEEWLESHEDYEPGDYALNPGEFLFGVQEYDEQLTKLDKIRFNVEDVRPAVERDFKVNFNIPIPGGRSTVGTLSVMPDVSQPGGAALESLRLLVRGMSAVIITYLFVRGVWTVIRQY